MSSQLNLIGKSIRKTYPLLAKMAPDRYGVTLVLTSCGRHDLLDVTLSSFFEHNHFPLVHIIIVEDGDSPSAELAQKYKSKQIEWIATGKRVGQIAAIDYAYSRVRSPYIFHMEDDWEFFRPGFIEKSMQILHRHPQMIQVWLRSLDNVNNHPFEQHIHQTHGAAWQKLKWDYIAPKGEWHGFSFNPGLRRLTDYRLTGGYGHLTEYDFNNPGKAESTIGKFFREKNFYAAILSGEDGCGHVKHIGFNRRVDSV